MDAIEKFCYLRDRGFKPSIYTTMDGWQVQAMTSDGGYVVSCHPDIKEAIAYLADQLVGREPPTYKARPHREPAKPVSIESLL